MTHKFPLGVMERQRRNETGLRQKVVAACAVAAFGALAGGYIWPVIVPAGRSPLTTVEVSRVVYPAFLVGKAEVKVSRVVYPSSLLWQMSEPVDEEWLMPTAAVAVGDELVVVDTGNNRILKVDEAGRVLATFDVTSTPGLSLRMPMALASDGGRLFVANSSGAEVLVLDLSGRVEAVLSLRPGANERMPRPIGVAVTLDGGIVVSDADNHRVLRLNKDGEVLWSAGAGIRAGGAEGFNVPGALAVDRAGYIYVVDTLNGRVVELSPKGSFVREFGRLGDAAGTLSRPKGVAVDGEGRVFVSDGLLAAVEVFAPDGTYLGLIGRRDPTDPSSDSLFVAPAGLALVGKRLLVTDRFAGVIAFDLSGAASPPAAE